MGSLELGFTGPATGAWGCCIMIDSLDFFFYVCGGFGRNFFLGERNLGCGINGLEIRN